MEGREASPGETRMTDARPSQEPGAAEGSSPGRPPPRDESHPLSLRSASTCTTYSLEISANTADPPPDPRPPPPGTDRQAEEVTLCEEKLGLCRIEPPRRTGSGPDKEQEARPPSASPDRDRDEMDDLFYSFVILHAPEDAQEASRLRARLEDISGTRGATFSEDFAQPGRSAFGSLEDAIENSAYVMLLLTANFNTRLSQTSVDSALLSSIERPHKYNTVVPLLPRQHRLARHETSLVLRSKNPLRETSDDARFQRQVRALLSPGHLSEQRSVWMREQETKRLREERRRLWDEERRRSQALREEAWIRELEERRPPPNPFQAFPRHPPPGTWAPQPSCIHIKDARYIMIGNNSTMTVGAAGDSGAAGDPPQVWIP